MVMNELADLIVRHRVEAGLTQSDVAERLSKVLGRPVQQSHVSDNERGARWSDPYLPSAYAQALEIPLTEILAATGYAPPPEGAATPPVTFQQVVRRDKTLSRVAKNHLLQQYKLLQLASSNDGTVLS